MTDATNAASDIRETIREFLHTRFISKAEKLDPSGAEYEKFVKQFNYDNWLANAAQRAERLQRATHSLKPVHPDAKGSSLYAPPSLSESPKLISTSVLGHTFMTDVVGNAAYLDLVHLFSKLLEHGSNLIVRRLH